MTSKSTALVRTHYSNELVARMALYSLRALEDFSKIGTSGFVRNGMVIVASESQRGALTVNLEMLRSVGVTTDLVERSESERLFPELLLKEDEVVVREPNSGYADPVSTANSYASRARELGATIILGKEVSRLLVESGALAGLQLSDGTHIKCEKAILCTNVWTNKLLLQSGISGNERGSLVLPITQAAHPVVILKRPQQYQGVRPSIIDIPNKAYYKPEGQSLELGGSLDPELDKQEVDPENCPTEVPFEFLSFFSKVISERVPKMKEGTMHSSYIGMYDITPDQHPIIDSLEGIGIRGAYCCVGLSGHGFKLCPALGRINSEMLSGVEARKGTFDWSRFSLGRFSAGHLLFSRYAEVGTIA